MEQTQSSKKRVILITSIVLVVVIGAIVAFAYNKVTQNPLVQYANAEKKTFNEVWDYYEEYYGDSQKLNERLLEEAYESSSEFTASVEVPAQLTMVQPQLAMVQQLIDSAALSTDVKVNPDSNETYAGLDVTMQGESLLNGHLYQNEENTSLQVPDLYDQYFTVNNKSLGEELEKQGIQDFPYDEVPNFAEIMKNSMTPEEAKEMAKEYLGVITDQLSEEKVNVTENEEYKGSTYTKLAVHFTEDEVRQILTDILTKMKDDERFKYQFGSTKLQKEEVDRLIGEVDHLSLPDGLDYEAYMSGDTVAYRNLSFNAADQAEVTVNMDTIVKENNEYEFNIGVEGVPNNGEGEFLVQYTEDGKPDGDAYNVHHVFNITASDAMQDIDASIEADSVLKENTWESQFHLVVNQPQMAQIPDISGHINTSSTNEENGGNSDFEFGLDFSMQDPNAGNITGGVTINGETEYSFTDDLEFPTVDKNNSVNVVELSDSEWQQIGREIQKNAMEHYQSLIGGGFGGGMMPGNF
ncbi:hypothetical protein GWK91_00655 [Virgibacillus sp. MSP4-1]|uniref:DUF6583 family protein n=1 Tax=Virgibacillus sp. MSP4-1 TaxID=2700081 RepID=UPI0003AA2ABC|nr:DUF6583 family protein [Virgibacillus sp. MSP4-1]QHS21556.1 hypothetical protein GWK91_00655 [Virgibacillus sp. MSP4-1]